MPKNKEMKWAPLENLMSKCYVIASRFAIRLHNGKLLSLLTQSHNPSDFVASATLPTASIKAAVLLSVSCFFVALETQSTLGDSTLIVS
jgi:hypothetical protein